MNRIIFIISFSFFVFLCFSKDDYQINISVKESYFEKPDDVFPLLENALNNNDPYKFISYFSLQYEIENINFIDISMYVKGGISTQTYFPGFENLLKLRILSDKIKNYVMIKNLILHFYSPELERALIINTQEDAEKIQTTALNNTKRKIKFKNIDKREYKTESLYKTAEGYLFSCDLYCGKDLITDMLLISIHKLNGVWRVTSIL